MSLRNAASAFEDEAWEYPRNHKHQLYICELMSFMHGRVDDPYDRNKAFSKMELLEIRPSDVKKYLLYKAFKDPNPGPNDAPVHARAESLKKAKSGVSFFMVNKGVAWIDGVGGNPTRHPLVKEAINFVEALETRGLGTPTNVKRKYSTAEFNKVLSLFRERPDFEHRVRYPMMAVWSYHLIHRIDDTCHFKVEAPHGNVDFPFTIKTRTKWSKNVRSMKNCPDQILLGSECSKTCALLWLSIYLETFLGDYPNAKYLFSSNTDDKAPKNVKQQLRGRLKKVVWTHPAFIELADETGDEAALGVGTHSNRKYASTLAQRMGAERLQVEYRGRWVGEAGRNVCSRVYIHADDTYTDAFVASLLCVGGAVKYELEDAFIVTDNWLYVECVPNIRKRFEKDARFCRVMALSYLWAVFDQETADYLNPVDVDRVRTNFQRLHGPVDSNPVKKTKIAVVKINGSLDIVELDSARQASGDQQGAPSTPGTLAGNTNEILGYMQRMERSVVGELQAIRAEQSGYRRWVSDQFDRMVRNQRRFGGTIGQALSRQDPARQARNRLHEAAVTGQRRAALVTPQREQVRANENRATTRAVRLGIHPTAKLATNLRSLHEFWEEFMFGVGENKPAKNFTTDEVNGQGNSFKNKYSRRMKIWRIQKYLINCGMNIEAANGRIVEVYGTDKPTPLMLIIQNDQKNPNYPFIGRQRFRPRLVVNTD